MKRFLRVCIFIIISSLLSAASADLYSFQKDYSSIDQAAKSIFKLVIYDQFDNEIGSGSGFLAFDNQTLVTNEHVIADAAYIIAYSDNYQFSYKVSTLLHADAEKDVAILQFDTPLNESPLRINPRVPIMRGQPVTAIGSPKGVLNTVSYGNISNIIYYCADVPDAIQFTAPISSGSSGGALFDDTGSVIGLCVSSRKEANDMHYAIPIKYVEGIYSKYGHTLGTTLTAYNNLIPESYTVDFGTFTMNLGANDYYETAEEMVNNAVLAIIYPNYDPNALVMDNINIVWSQADATAEIQSIGAEKYAQLVLDIAKPQFEALNIKMSNAQVLSAVMEENAFVSVTCCELDYTGAGVDLVTPQYQLQAYYLLGEGGTYVFTLTSTSVEQLDVLSAYLDSVVFY